MESKISANSGQIKMSGNQQSYNIDQICMQLEKFNGGNATEEFRTAVHQAGILLRNQEIAATVERVISSGTLGATGGAAMGASASNRGPTSQLGDETFIG